MSKRIPYEQLVIVLDQLFFGGTIENDGQAICRADAIENYLKANDWTWDQVLDEETKDNE